MSSQNRTAAEVRKAELSERADNIISGMTDKKIVVFVQFGGNDLDAILKRASNEIDRRSLFISARDLIHEIPPFSSFKKPQSAPAAKRLAKKASSAHLVTKTPFTPSEMRLDSLQRLAPFIKSDWFKATRERNLQGQRRGTAGDSSTSNGLPTHFYAASCAVMTLSKEDLHHLPDELMQLPSNVGDTARFRQGQGMLGVDERTGAIAVSDYNGK